MTKKICLLVFGGIFAGIVLFVVFPFLFQLNAMEHVYSIDPYKKPDSRKAMDKLAFLACCPGIDSLKVRKLQGNTYEISVSGPNPCGGSCIPMPGEIFVDSNTADHSLRLFVGWNMMTMATMSNSPFCAGGTVEVPPGVKQIIVRRGFDGNQLKYELPN